MFIAQPTICIIVPTNSQKDTRNNLHDKERNKIVESKRSEKKNVMGA